MKQIIIIILIMFSFLSCNKNKKLKIDQSNITRNEIVELRFFGPINLSNARDYEVDNVQINQNEVSIDLNFEGDDINPKSLDGVHNILNNIEDIERHIKNEIRGYIDQDGMVKEYFQFHIEEIDNQKMIDYLKDADQNLTKELQLFSKLELNRLGFYPDSPKFFAVFDYRILGELSDEILVILMNEKGEIEKITIES